MFTCPLSGRRGASARRTFFAALVACCLLLQQSASAFAPQTNVRKRAGAAPSLGRKGAKPSVPTGLLVPGTASTVFINEIHYDNTGTDAGEFIEVAGPAGTNLTGWSIVLYNGNGGASYDTDALTGTIPSQQGGYGTVSISYPSNGIQNGSPDGVALVDGTTLVQFLCYEGTFAATNGPANGQTCTDIGVSEDGTEATGNSLQLTGSGDNYGDFTWTGPTAATQNSPNTGQTFAAATPTPTPTPGGLPALSIDDVSQDEGDSGQTNFTFTVSSDQTSDGSIVFNICTQDGTAQDASGTGEDDDYNLFCLTNQSIPNGQTSSQFSVQVNGDTEQESDETFLVNITQLSGATAADGQGVGTIQNDDIALVLISQVQGSGASSPLVGQTVSVRGVVTLIKSNGFFVQEEVGDNDSDPNTSEGVFVFTSSAPPISVGDNVTVTGEVVEFNGLTEISTPGGGIVVTNSTGNTLPTAVTIDTTILDPAAGPTQPQLEKYEGMRMTAASLTTVAPNDNFFDVYTVLSSVARPMREPGIPASDPVPPDPTSGTPDPNIPNWDENPERLIVDTNGRAGSTNTAYTSNVTFTNVAGPLDFSFGAYRLVPEAALTASANMSAVPVPTPAAGEFLVAGYNIENFNNDATQREKAALTIRDVMHLPAIIGVAEIFDLADLQELAAEVDLMSGGTTAYEARLVEQDGTSEDNDQDVGFLVDTARVSITSTTVERASDTFINPNDGQPETLHDRPPFVLRAVVDPSGAALPVIVVVNHTRSFIDIELVAGEGARVRAKRKAQAESIAGLLQELQTNNPGVPVIAVGDYNAFQFNNGYDDPVSVMKGNPTPDDQIVVDQSPDVVDPNFANLIDDLPAAEQYSFIFEGTPQA
ncbi:MAG TPA: hypothetical protein VD968_14545, partial [Pyrinomonadaceae bacterium]|nr:hypothetical protein [Pyrinomonadaceae bacterium]